MRSLAGAVVLLATAMAGLGLYVAPERADEWVRMPVVLWVLFAVIEAITRNARGRGAEETTRWHWATVAVCGLVLTLRSGSRIAWTVGLIDVQTAWALRRMRGVLIGLAAVVWGNKLPKLVSPWVREREPFDWQGVHRFVGRVGAAWGGTLVAAWLFLPLVSAQRVSVAATSVMVLVCLARKWGSVAAYSVRGGPARS